MEIVIILVVRWKRATVSLVRVMDPAWWIGGGEEGVPAEQAGDDERHLRQQQSLLGEQQQKAEHEGDQGGQVELKT